MPTSDLPPAGARSDWAERLGHLLDHFETLAGLEHPDVALRYPDRDPGGPPRAGEDPFGAIVRFCHVAGAPSGPLSGLQIGVKDAIPVAGVPSGDGTTPVEDAVVVERLLDAGASVVAKTTVGFPGIEDPAERPPVRNPHDPRYSPGGSSAGSAAAVAAGLVDAALGTDAAGSVRIPAAWCGLVGMKPTSGLVPLHGCQDHRGNAIGPITRTVAENAALLRVLGGADWRDPLAGGVAAGADYPASAGGGVDGLVVGVVQEALEPIGATPPTRAAFAAAVDVLTRLGATVRPVSIPIWPQLAAVFFPVHVLGLVAEAGAFGSGHGNVARTDLVLAAAAAGRSGAPVLGDLRELVAHIRDMDGGRLFTVAQNLVVDLRRQLDALLDDVAVLVTPTTPAGPPPIPASSAEVRQRFARPWPPMVPATGNTWAFNLSGHPALTVPAGTADHGLPTGLQLAGRRFDERSLYQIGFAFEAVVAGSPEGGR